MDQDYITAREKHALHMAAVSTSTSARAAHRAFAKAYGLILKARHFPNIVVRPEGQGKKIESAVTQTLAPDSTGIVSKWIANDAA